MWTFSYQSSDCNCGATGACSFCYNSIVYPYIAQHEIRDLDNYPNKVTVSDLQNVVLNDIFNMSLKTNTEYLNIYRSRNNIRAEYRRNNNDTHLSILIICLTDNNINILSRYNNTSISFDYLKYEEFLVAALEVINDTHHLFNML